MKSTGFKIAASTAIVALTMIAGTAQSNGSKGIEVNANADDTVITGSVISNGGFMAIELNGPSGVEISGNLIGTNPAGTTAAGNLRGISVGQEANNTTIGGPTLADRNVIADSAQDAIEISTNPGEAISGTTISGTSGSIR